MSEKRSPPFDPKLQEYKIAAFLEAVRRCRWFLLATVIVSTIILAQSYLTRYSYTQRQMEAFIRDDISRGLETRFDARRKELEAEFQKAGADQRYRAERRLERHAGDYLAFTRAKNALASAKSADRPLWLLSFNVPEQDFMPVMGMMLAVFCIGLWLSARAMVQAVRTCDRQLREVARLNLLFPVSTGNGRQEDMVARIIEVVAVWMPFLVFLWATVGDILPLLGGLSSRGDLALTVPGDAVILRLQIVVCLLIVLGVTALACTVKMQEMDSLLRPEPEPAAKPQDAAPKPGPSPELQPAAEPAD